VALIGTATALTTCSILLATPGIVKTKSGHTYYGEVTRAADGVVVTIHGSETRVPQADVESVSDQPGNFQQDFEARRKLLDSRTFRDSSSWPNRAGQPRVSLGQ
jgi:hypothetical protein